MELTPYITIYVLSFLVLLGTAYYVYLRRKSIDEMHSMMVGMTFGMLSGLLTATLFLIPTGNFLLGVVIGTFAGLLFGIPFGKLGGHLGIMEGIIAGPMGGMMGAMLGQMVRPFNIDVFIPFFMFIFLITIVGISYAVHCGASCCTKKSEAKKPVQLSKTFFLVWGIISIVLLAVSILISFSLEEQSSVQTQSQTTLQLPPALQQFVQEEKKEAILKNGYQEIDLEITGSKYSPNIIVVKKGILLKIHAHAAKNAGCAREIVFPDFNKDEIIPADGTKTIEITPLKEGTFVFRCSMDMIRGKLVVQ